MASDKKLSELPVASVISSNDISVLVKNNVDYQFSFDTLSDFIESELSVGANISFGNTLPGNNNGKNGDIFINIVAGYFAQKIEDTWTVVYTLPIGNSADGTVLYGANVPGVIIGKDNDTYIDTIKGIFYKKAGNVWIQVFSMQTGPPGIIGPEGPAGVAGANGKTILSGAGEPSNLYTGSDGDYYVNTNNYYFFGPKVNGAWSTGFPLDNQIPDPIFLLFQAGSTNPIVIENFQNTYAQVFGNQPSIFITEKVNDDGNGNPAESTRNDLRPLKYYSDSPINALLIRISIDTGDGSTLSNDYTIKLTI